MAQDTSLTPDEVDGALRELVEAGLVMYDYEKSIVLILNAVKYLQRTKPMRKSVVNDAIYINSPLTEELVKRHQLRQWDEWTEEAEFALSSRNSGQGWEDDGIQF
jgi:hypothetical protein